MAKTVLTNFRLDEETHRKFRIWCIENGTTAADHLRKMIDDTLAGKTYAKAEEKRAIDKKKADLNAWLENEWN